MQKSKMVPGNKYLHHRKLDIDGRELEAERWVKYLEPTKMGGLFQYEYEVFELSDNEILKELV